MMQACIPDVRHTRANLEFPLIAPGFGLCCLISPVHGAQQHALLADVAILSHHACMLRMAHDSASCFCSDLATPSMHSTHEHSPACKARLSVGLGAAVACVPCARRHSADDVGFYGL
jgi:hypothetical protein